MLTPRETEVLTHIAHGHTDETTARALHLAPTTVKAVYRRAASKLGADTRAHAIHLAYQAGVLRPAQDPAGAERERLARALEHLATQLRA